MHKPNIILISVDSLRFDHLSCFGYHKTISPNIDTLASQSYIFKNAFSCGPNTPHSFPGIMGSQYALMSNRFGLYDVEETFAEILKRNNYKTIAIIAANPFLSCIFKYDRGFDKFYDFFGFSNLTGTLRLNQIKISSEQNLRLTNYIDSLAKSIKKYFPLLNNINKLNTFKVYVNTLLNFNLTWKNKKLLMKRFYKKVFEEINLINYQPFFLWLHLMETHYPYCPDKKYIKKINKNIRDWQIKHINTCVKHNFKIKNENLLQITKDLYDASILEMDNQIGLILNLLKSKDFYDKSIIIFTSDHGEELNDHKGFKHTAKMYEELIHIPLIIKLPDYEKNPKEIHNLFTHLDIIPTICSLLEIDYNRNTMFGLPFDFTTNNCGRAFIIVEATFKKNGEIPSDDYVFNLQALPKIYGLRTSKFKYIFNTKSEEYLFNLISDPYEQFNIINEKKEIALKMRELLNIHIKRENSINLKKRIKFINMKEGGK